MSVLYTDIGRVFTVLRYVISVYHVYGVCGYYVREYIYIYIYRERERERRETTFDILWFELEDCL